MIEHFFIIGAQRCGTTRLARLLDTHPDIQMASPMRPEPKYFLRQDSVDPVDYESRYFDERGARVRGEKSTSYMDSPEAAERIAAAYPMARIVASLRNPVDRAVSHYRFSVDNGLEDLSIQDAMREESEARPWDRNRVSVSPYLYLRRGRFVEDLRPWIDLFGAESVSIVILEESAVSDGPMRSLLRDLHVPARDLTLPERVVNPASSPMPEGAEEVRERLRRYYAESIRELEDVMGRPIPSWGTPGAI